jgi:hypothetical protein
MPLPEEWQLEVEGDTIVVSDRDGVGALEFSVLEFDGAEPGAEELAELAAEFVPAGQEAMPVRCGEWEGLRFEYLAGDYCRDWVLRYGQRVLLISYTCDGQHQNMDDAVVDEMLGELTVGAEKTP